jgi:large subunit ribosomal protein L18
MRMNHSPSQSQKRVRRHAAVRSRVSGTAERPRLAVFRSNQYIYAQIIDDVAGKTLAASSDLATELSGTKTARATSVGSELAEKAKKLGITTVVFDRGGFKYAGRIAAVATGARESGLQF